MTLLPKFGRFALLALLSLATFQNITTSHAQESEESPKSLFERLPEDNDERSQIYAFQGVVGITEFIGSGYAIYKFSDRFEKRKEILTLKRWMLKHNEELQKWTCLTNGISQKEFENLLKEGKIKINDIEDRVLANEAIHGTDLEKKRLASKILWTRSQIQKQSSKVAESLERYRQLALREAHGSSIRLSQELLGEISKHDVSTIEKAAKKFGRGRAIFFYLPAFGLFLYDAASRGKLLLQGKDPSLEGPAYRRFMNAREDYNLTH